MNRTNENRERATAKNSQTDSLQQHGPRGFVSRWFASRDSQKMLQGVPAILAAVFFIFLAGSGQSLSSTETAQRYRSMAEDALQKGNSKTANLWMRKVLILDKDGPEAQTRAAMLALQEGNTEKADAILVRLAPDNDAGHTPAHLLRAQQMMATWDNKDSSIEETLRHHLDVVIEKDPENIPARELLGRLEMLKERFDAAIENYETLNSMDATFAVVLAKLHIVKGDRDASLAVVDSALKKLYQDLKDRPDDVKTRIACAQLEGFMERFARCIELLTEGLTRKPPPSSQETLQLRIQLGNAYTGYARQIQRSNPEMLVERLELLQRALKLMPGHPEVMESLAELVRTDSAEARKAFEILSEAVKDGTATPMVHLILAIAASERGKFNLEQQLLEKALAKDPTLVVAMNNLAWRLAVGSPPELEKALELINQAVTRAPRRFDILATRGRIHKMLGNNTKALRDLEVAQTQLDGRPDIHDALAELFAEAGDENLASYHRNQANAVRAESQSE